MLIRTLSLLKNKYFIAGTAFIIWMLFFDRNDLLSQYGYRQQLKELEAKKEFYSVEIEKTVKDLNELSSDRRKLEKFARGKYLMKKPNEDVFVIVKEEKKEKKKGLF